MKRIDYLPSWSERYIGFAIPSPLGSELRAPLVAFAGSIAFAIVLWTVQETRLHGAQHDGAAIAERLASMQPEVERVRGLERDLVRARDVDSRVAAIRRSGAARANEIAALGNRLPAEVWLTALRADRGTLVVEGHSARLAAVGTALASLAALPAYGAAQLVTVHEDTLRSGVTYALVLEPTP